MIKIYFLGTGAGAPSPSRWTASIAVAVGSSIYLLDCGEGCQLRLSMLGISPLKISALFLTHEHGDHVLGAAPLIESMSHHGRKDPLYIVSSQSVLELIRTAIKITSRGISFDLYHRSPWEGYEDSNIEARGFRSCHSNNSWGYRIYIKKKNYTICYTGDTSPCEDVIRYCKESQILIHDATFSQENVDEARESMHSTALEAARIASEARARYLYLTHISSRNRDPAVLIREARAVFRNTRIAEDLMTIYII